MVRAELTDVSIQQSQTTMSQYFKALATGEFAHFFTTDVTWTTIQSSRVVSGQQAVQEAILCLHADMSDVRIRSLTVSDGAAYIEGDCLGTAGCERISYCVAYDIADDRIAAMRAYGALATMMP